MKLPGVKLNLIKEFFFFHLYIDIELDTLLERIESSRFKVYPVTKKIILSSFLVEQSLTFKIGCVYYEFARKEEDISEDKHIILMSRVMILMTPL